MAIKGISSAGLVNALAEIIALSVENQIKLDALEQVFEKTNLTNHELYLAEIKMLRDQKAIKLNHTFAATLKEKLRER
jgi:hypothetical protein